MPKLVPLLAAGVALATSIGGVSSYSLVKDVTIDIDGQVSSRSVLYGTVAELLTAQGVTLTGHDEVSPTLPSAVSDGTIINVRHGRQINLTLDGVPLTVWTTQSTVGTALTAFGVDTRNANVSATLSSSIGLDGATLTVDTAKNVTVTAGGTTREVSTTGSVSDALIAAGVNVDTDDLVTPSADTALSDGLAITAVNVESKLVTRTSAIPFAQTSTNDPTLTAGTSTVKTKGVDGVTTHTIAQTLHDGVVVTETEQSAVLTTPAIDQVTLVGTKAKAAAAPAASTSSSTSSSAATSSGSSVTPASGNVCQASNYGNGDGTDGGPTASGEIFRASGMTAAHKTLPLGTKIKVTNVANGKTVVVRINDRGPYVAGRCLDLSYGAFTQIGSASSGVLTVAWEIV